MNDRFITIATFDTPLHANMAKTALEHAGIQGFVADETMGSNWVFNNAIGGVKLQVNERDLVVARKVLDDTSPVDFSGSDTTPAFDAEEGSGDDPEEKPEPPLTRREEDADRAFRGAVLGLLLAPLQLYVSWLLIKVFVSKERLQPRQRQRAFIAAAINLPLVLFFLWLLRSFARGTL